jgi:radical SAM protein with 4Fe4S-binding SPASM domain
MNRFTLRPEYFGGILHDAQEITCHLLSPEEFKILRQIVLKENTVSNEARLKVQKFLDIGACQANIRCVRSPKIMPQHCLTAPIRIYHTYTHQCNLRCSQCCVSSTADYVEQRMSLKQVELVMNKFYEAGTMEWRFTGGEPTSCSDFIDALGIAKGLGMAIMLNTNGCWSDKLLEYLPEAGIGEIIVSLEGREEVNDKRRSRGVYRNILKVLNRIRQHNQNHLNAKIRVTINMTVAKDNVGEVDFVVRLAASFGFNANFVPLRPYGRTLTDLTGAILSTEEFMKFSENVQRLREDPEIKNSGSRIIHRNMDLFCPDYPDKSALPYPFKYSDCGALSTGFGLCSDGKVNACTFLTSDPDFIGPSMLEVSVQEAWLHPSMEFFRKASKVGCLGCRFYMKQCEGKCRAMVLANDGKITDGKLIGYDPYCFRHLMPRK